MYLKNQFLQFIITPFTIYNHYHRAGKTYKIIWFMMKTYYQIFSRKFVKEVIQTDNNVQIVVKHNVIIIK
jgi:hypothetical protein